MTMKMWSAELHVFDMNGNVYVTLRGENSKGTEQVVELKLCEDGLRQFAEDLRDKYRILRRRRIAQDLRNLEIFNTEK